MSGIKTDIKMKVTPEQSRKVQEICFANGVNWGFPSSNVVFTDEPFLFIYKNCLTYGRISQEEHFNRVENEEVSAELFIRTNGTCVESETPTEFEQMLEQKTSTRSEEVELRKRYMVFVEGKNTPRYIHDSYDSAETEAKRLSTELVGLKVSIVEIVKEFRSKVVVKEI